MFESIKKLFKGLFSAMGLFAVIIGGLTVFIGERIGARCAPSCAMSDAPTTEP